MPAVILAKHIEGKGIEVRTPAQALVSTGNE
jgi:hypothetical protein